tara:strand:+ start:1213 stop:1596 length:384 start_codon:yes stop_codon:yes gene_type:complete
MPYYDNVDGENDVFTTRIELNAYQIIDRLRFYFEEYNVYLLDTEPGCLLWLYITQLENRYNTELNANERAINNMEEEKCIVKPIKPFVEWWDECWEEMECFEELENHLKKIHQRWVDAVVKKELNTK